MANETVTMIDGKRVYPCRCGQTHAGDYAFEDWNHHNCYHRSPLVPMDFNMLLCMDCGKVFSLACPDCVVVHRIGTPHTGLRATTAEEGKE